MEFIRILWGDFDKYKEQIIQAKQDGLNETVLVWGRSNFEKLKQLGYKCMILGEDAYDYKIAKAHTFEDHRSLIHKIKAIGLALEVFDEIIFVDWDVRKIKEIDSNFYDLIKNKNSELQVPLYVYPKKAFDILLNDVKEPTMQIFFTKLQYFIEKYSYKVDDNLVLPNTGFFYCSNKKIIDQMLSIIESENLQTVPDELSVFAWSNCKMNDYILKYEPSVIGVKEHGYEWWNIEEFELMKYKQTMMNKDIYFEHL